MIPGPLPLGVAVIDSAIALFGHIFPFVPHKHRAQLMNHFHECIDKNKGSRQRQQAIQTNIFAAFLAALKVSTLFLYTLLALSVQSSAQLVKKRLGKKGPIS